MVITALEQERLTYINTLMQELHSDNVIIYESLCDREYVDTKLAIDRIQERLKNLSDSIQDEIENM